MSIGMTTGVARQSVRMRDAFGGGLRGDQRTIFWRTSWTGSRGVPAPALREGQELLDDPVETADLVPDEPVAMP